MSEALASEVLIVGGGLSGAALATTLASAGRDVLLAEKSVAAHPKVCGEFLSHEALHYLRLLGVDPEALGAVPIESVRLAKDSILAASPLPFRALSLSRECLDEALLARATAAGARVLRGSRVQRLCRPGQHGTDWRAEVSRDRSFTARHTFLATGKHDLHGWARSPGRQNDLLAFKMYYRLAAVQQGEIARHVELIVFKGGYAGLQPMEGGLVNLCLLVSQRAFQQAGGSWASLLPRILEQASHLATRLEGSTALWDRPLGLSAIPYGLVRREAGDGLWRLGDQSSVIPSFAGDGMSIALHSARLAADAFEAGESAGRYQQRLAEEIARQVRMATLLSRTLVSGPRPLLMAARLFPSLLARVASRTRIHTRHLRG